MIRNFFNWIFSKELNEMKAQTKIAAEIAIALMKQKIEFDDVLAGIDVSVDVHEYDNKYSPSWAVISLQGQKTDYIKFVNLGTRNIQEISSFLHQYERRNNLKIDASPNTSQFLRVTRSERF